MKITVDLDVCEGHGQCEFAAPEVFEVTDDSSVDYQETAPESQRAAVVKAAAVCPVRAIAIGD